MTQPFLLPETAKNKIADSPLPNNWLLFYLRTYLLAGAIVLGGAVVFFSCLLFFAGPSAPLTLLIGSVITFILFRLFVMVQMRKLSKTAFVCNWLVIAVDTVLFAFQLYPFTNLPTQAEPRIVFAVLLILSVLCWFLPNAIYFGKRRSLFGFGAPPSSPPKPSKLFPDGQGIFGDGIDAFPEVEERLQNYPKGLRWYYFYQYGILQSALYLYLLAAVRQSIQILLSVLQNAIINPRPIVWLLFFSIILVRASGALSELQKNSMKFIIGSVAVIAIIPTCFVFLFLLDYFPSLSPLPFVAILATVFLVWFVPNTIYFRRRRDLFTLPNRHLTKEPPKRGNWLK